MTTGTITSIKVGSYLTGTVNSFDFCVITVKENGTNLTWGFYLWLLHDGDPAVRRILASQRLALAREAAFRNLTVTIGHEIASSNVDTIEIAM